MKERISRFLRHHHVLTLSTVSDQGSWTAHCFYAYLPDCHALVFTTDPLTRHGREMLVNPHVSGGIMLETRLIGKIRGIQLTGRAFPVNVVNSDQGKTPEIPNLTGRPSEPEVIPEQSKVRSAYLRRFPFAIAGKLDLWILWMDYVKMTDNRLGFGKKLEWKRFPEL